jgi:hypothetical protein
VAAGQDREPEALIEVGSRPFFKRQLRAAIHMADSLGYIRIDTICEWVDADAR